MSAVEKITEIFNKFPFINNTEVENYTKTLEFTVFKRNSLSIYFPEVENGTICISCRRIGDFSKSASVGGEKPHPRYSCGFVPIEQGKKVISLFFLEKDTVNDICNNVIKFIVTAGQDKSDLPLLINTFPELAHHFLQI